MEIVSVLPGRLRFKTGFIHEGKLTIAQVTLDWFQMRIPDTTQDLWVIVAETDHLPDPLVLITNRPVRSAADARAIYNDWRRRPTIKLYYRFVQEDGLDVEKIQLQKLERIRREFILILALSLFVLRLPDVWHPSLILWFRRLGSATAGTDSLGWSLLAPLWHPACVERLVCIPRSSQTPSPPPSDLCLT